MRITTKAVFQMNKDGSFTELERDSYEYDGKVAAAKGGGGGGGNSVTTTIPWAEQRPFLTDIWDKAQAAQEGPGPQYFGGNTIAPFTGLERQGQNQVLNVAQQTLPGMLGETNQAFSRGLNASDVTNNPMLNKAVSGAIDPVVEKLMQQVMPGIRGGAIQAGQYGGSRQGIAEGMAIDAATEDMLNISSQMMSDAYNTGLQTQTQNMALAPQQLAAQLMPAQLTSGVGEARRGMNQANIDADVARWNFEQMQPMNVLDWYSNLVQGNNWGGTTNMQTRSSGGGSSPLAGAAGGAMLGSQIMPGWGTAAGAVLGGLFG
jgi:hypothetical protein